MLVQDCRYRKADYLMSTRVEISMTKTAARPAADAPVTCRPSKHAAAAMRMSTGQAQPHDSSLSQGGCRHEHTCVGNGSGNTTGAACAAAQGQMSALLHAHGKILQQAMSDAI